MATKFHQLGFILCYIIARAAAMATRAVTTPPLSRTFFKYFCTNNVLTITQQLRPTALLMGKSSLLLLALNRLNSTSTNFYLQLLREEGSSCTCSMNSGVFANLCTIFNTVPAESGTSVPSLDPILSLLFQI